MMSWAQAFNLSHATTNLLIDLAMGRRERVCVGGGGRRVRDERMILLKKYIIMGSGTLRGWKLAVVWRRSLRIHPPHCVVGNLWECFMLNAIWAVLTGFSAVIAHTAMLCAVENRFAVSGAAVALCLKGPLLYFYDFKLPWRCNSAA